MPLAPLKSGTGLLSYLRNNGRETPRRQALQIELSNPLEQLGYQYLGR